MGKAFMLAQMELVTRESGSRGTTRKRHPKRQKKGYFILVNG